jgi:hypothetical protein
LHLVLFFALLIGTVVSAAGHIERV